MAHKGGVGKTMLTLNLAIVAMQDGFRSAIVDLDPQASAEFWYDQRLQAPAPRALGDPLFYGAKSARLAQTLAQAKADGAELVLIDTPPRMDAGARSVAEVADFILVPSRPSVADTHAIIDNLNTADSLQKPACVVLNGCPVGAGLAAEIGETIANGLNFPIAPIYLGQRVAYARAFAAGLGVGEHEPAGKAAMEIGALWAWLRPHLGLSRSTANKEAA